MKKYILSILIFLIFFTLSINISSAIIVNKSGPYYPGDSIGFNKDCHDYSRGTSKWNFGDGTVITYPDDNDRGFREHTFATAGTYVVSYTHGTAYSTPMCLEPGELITPAPYTETYIIKIESIVVRSLTATPSNPKVDQKVTFSAVNFTGSTLAWNFGDGAVLNGGPFQIHRYNSAGVYTVNVRELDIAHDPVTATITVSPDDRFIQVSSSEVRIGTPVTVFAYNFIGDSVLWKFGDGTELIGGTTITHIYSRPGNYKIMAIDEAGESTKFFETYIKIFGLSDEILLEIAELKFDNGKYYMVVPKNSDKIKPLLKLKMRGTGIITGQWLVDGVPYGLVSEFSSQGEVKEITTNRALPVPTIDPGLHTVSFRLTRPATEVVFPTLRYYVLPYEKSLETFSPPNGFVAKENEIPEFSWGIPTGGAAKYQIAFSNSLFDLLNNRSTLVWNEVGGELVFTPGKVIWDGLKRNRWTYWRVRAFDSFNKVVGESGINELKIVIAEAEITLNKVTNLKGEEIPLGKDGLNAGQEMFLINGTIEYKDDSKFLILQVLLDENIINQLLFRDVKKGESRTFETSVPGRNKGKIMFRVLKTSSPSVIVGIKGILLK